MPYYLQGYFTEEYYTSDYWYDQVAGVYNLTDTLIFYESVDFDQSIGDVITTTVDCDRVRTYTLPEDLLVFTECLSYDVLHRATIINRFLSQTLVFTDVATIVFGGITTVSLTDTLVFSQSLSYPFTISQFLTFIDSVTVSSNISNAQSLAQTLSFTDSSDATKIHIIAQSVSDTLTFTDTHSEGRLRELSSELSDVLSFSDLVSVGVQLNFYFNDTLIFTEDRISKANYIDSGFFFPVAYVTKTKNLTILSGKGVVTLPPPEWGDSKMLRNEINLRRAMSGKVYTYVKTSTRSRLKYVYKISRKKSFELKQFLQNNMAERILIHNNWNGEVWLTKIAENPIEFQFENSSRTENGRISVELQFEGVQMV